METQTYETMIHRSADRAHEAAQRSGLAVDYTVAAELYEKAGDYNKARICREAAERLQS